jgi:hypothetical protein
MTILNRTVVNSMFSVVLRLRLFDVLCMRASVKVGSHLSRSSRIHSVRTFSRVPSAVSHGLTWARALAPFSHPWGIW